MADFVAKTLEETTKAIEHAVFASDFSSRQGFLQRLDPRTKIITFFILLLITAWIKQLNFLLFFYFLTLVLAVISNIPLGFFIKRVWVFIPIFTGIIAIPAIFNIVTPGKPVFTLFTLAKSYHLGPYTIPKDITITMQGLTGAAIFIMRVATSVSLAILMVLTTQWTRLLKALNILKVPEIIILILAMTYRYIFLLLRVAEGMFLARKSRLILDTSLKEQHSWLSARIGVLIGKSYNLSNEVHLAMLARGWNGNPSLLEENSFGFLDVLWFVVVLLLLVTWIILREKVRLPV